MTERADQPATPEIPHGVPGKALAAQREALGWTVEQVADQLKLAVRQVSALEAGDYAALPGPAVVRGFVRAYAKILKLDAAPLVAMIELDTPAPESAVQHQRPQKPATFSESSRFPSHSRRGGLPLGWIAAAVVVVAAGAAAWHFGLLPVAGGDAANAGQAASTTVLTTPESASATLAQAPVQNPSVPLISVPSAAPEAGQAAAAPAATAPGDAGPATVAPVTAAPAPAAAAAPAAGANALVLNVREDAWVEVRPAKGGAPLISRLVRAGSTETVEVTEPVNVVVGNAPAVSASLRGAPVELPLAPGKTVSRISLK